MQYSEIRNTLEKQVSEIVQLYYGHSGDSLSGAQGHPDDLIKWRADQPHETQSAVERMFSDAKRVLTRDRTLLHSSTIDQLVTVTQQLKRRRGSLTGKEAFKAEWDAAEEMVGSG